MNKEIQAVLNHKNRIQKSKPWLLLTAAFINLLLIILYIFAHRPLDSAPVIAVACAVLFLAFYAMKQAKINLAILEKLNSIEEKLKV